MMRVQSAGIVFVFVAVLVGAATANLGMSVILGGLAGLGILTAMKG